MWVAIVAVGIVVLGLAAYAALGHLGEMPGDPVTDSPRGRVPDGPIDAEFVASAVLPRRLNGYAQGDVDAYLAAVAAGDAGPATDVTFRVAVGGYNMAVVDELIERVARSQLAVEAADEDDQACIEDPDREPPIEPDGAVEPGEETPAEA